MYKIFAFKIANKIRNIFNFILDSARLKNFFYGYFYPVYVALFVTLFFATKTQLLGLLAISITASIIFIKFRDVTPVIPLLFFVVLIFRDYSAMNNFLAYVFLAPAIISFIAKFFIYPVKNFKPGSLFVPLILVSYALFLGGFLSPLSNYINGLPVMVTIGPTMLIIYCFFSAYVTPPENFCIKKYVCYLLILLGLTSFLHLLIYRLNMNEFKNNILGTVYLGWGNINCAATLILISMASCWYFIATEKNIIPFFIILVILFIGVILSNSSGVLGICVAFTPVLMFFTNKKITMTNRRIFKTILTTVCTLFILLICVSIAIFRHDNILDKILPFFSESQRTKLFKEAVELFAKYPIFGVGLGYDSGKTLTTTNLMLYNFHSVFFHVLGTMGIVGIIAYSFYYFARFKILMQNDTCFSLFATITFIMFECYAFIDTAEFNAIPLMSTMTVFLTIVELTNKKGNDTTLPLNFNYFYNSIY